MQSLNWLIKILNKKFIVTYIISIIGAVIMLVSMRNYTFVFSFLLISTGFIVLINRCYFDKFINNNISSLFILNSDIKLVIYKYYKTMFQFTVTPIVVLVIYGITRNLLYDNGKSKYIIIILLTSTFIFLIFKAYILSLFIIKQSVMKLIEIFIIMIASTIGIIYMMYEEIYVFVMIIMIILLINYIYFNTKNIVKERIVRIFL
jgi:hypothetical protein